MIGVENKKRVDIFPPKFCNLSESNSEQLVSTVNIEDKNYLYLCTHSKKCKICTETLNKSSLENTEFLLDAHFKVKKSDVTNYLGCQISVNHRMNLL